MSDAIWAWAGFAVLFATYLMLPAGPGAIALILSGYAAARAVDATQAWRHTRKEAGNE